MSLKYEPSSEPLHIFVKKFSSDGGAGQGHLQVFEPLAQLADFHLLAALRQHPEPRIERPVPVEGRF